MYCLDDLFFSRLGQVTDACSQAAAKQANEQLVQTQARVFYQHNIGAK